MDKVQKNLNDLERKLGKANKIVAKGDKLSYGDAIKLGQKSNAIVSSIKKGIKEYDGITPTDDEARKVLAQMDTIVSLTETQLGLMVEHKATFDRLHVAGLVKKNVVKTRETSLDLSKIMIGKAPADLKPHAEELEKKRAMAFENAMRSFESSTGGEDDKDAEAADDSD